MTNSKASQRHQHTQKLWLPSLLLLAQFLTIAPALLVVFAGDEQRSASDGYVTLLDQLDRLSFTITELENIPQPVVRQDGVTQIGEAQGGSAASAAWQQQYSNYRGELNRVLASSALAPQIRETLARVDSIVKRMANTESDLAGLNKRPETVAHLTAGFRTDGRTARTELLGAQRLVGLELSTTSNSILQKATYLKALVAGICLFAFGVVLVVRRFRIDAAIQRKLQQELRTVNEEVIAALAAARSESKAKNQFLAHVGHLMRTPLDAIVGGADDLLQTDLTGQQRDCAQTSRDLAESLTRVARQVIDYSRIESGLLELQSVEFEPAGIVTDVLQLFSLPAERKGVKLKTAIGNGLPSVVKGDPERLRQVLVNLMSNAVRFTQQGEILLRVKEVNGAEGRTSLGFEVKDTGIGIAEQIRNCIFQPLSQVAGSGGNEGTGVGLAISKKLVELMGGKLDVASEPGRGSTFGFTAVFETVHADTKPQPESSKPDSSSTSIVPAAGVARGKKQGRERRTEPRRGINYPTLLRSEQAGVSIIRVLDVSTSGLRVSVPFSLNIHSEVEIRIEGKSVVGVVRNCSCIRANEFHVGIEIPRATSDDEQFLHHLRLLGAERARS
jgi:signal transduction histidine kinase